MPVRDLLNAASGASAPSDPYFYDVSMLLTGDGTNGAQNNTFLDSSTNNFTITRNGNTTQGAFSPYGNLWSNYFDGSGDYLTAPASTQWQFTGDHTIEAWIYVNSLSADGTIYGTGGSGAADQFTYTTGGQLYWGNIGTATGVITTNSWIHVAASRSGTTLKIFINGVEKASSTVSGTIGQNLTAYIGRRSDGFNAVNGYISNLRIVKGTALYTIPFTPSTTPLTAVSGTSLLTCQSNRFIDNSSNNFTITRNGDVKVTKFSPFNPTTAYSASEIGGSGYFDGTGDYLRSPAGTFNFSSGTAFTVDCWIYPTSFPVTYPALINPGASGTDQTFSLYLQNDGKVTYGKANVGDVISAAAGTIKLNQWNHIAIGKSSANSARMWVNGASVGTATDSYSYANTVMTIGSGYSGNAFAGYIASLRSVNGTDVYGVGNATITIPTAPLTAITNTSLLCNFTNAGIPDAAMMNDLETVGNAQVSTSVKKYGTGSLAFDGTGDYLSFPWNSNFDFGSGDFTIECWWYPTNTNNQALISNFYNYMANKSWELLYESGQVRFQTNIGGTFDNGGYTYTPATNTWIHVAGVRSGTNKYLFINGSLVKTVSVSGSLDSSGSTVVRVGARVDGTYVLNGYIDDLRITKGYARYTANFTPPTAALPTY